MWHQIFKADHLKYPFKRLLRKMVKHTHTFRRLLPMNCFSMFDHFVRLALRGISCKILFAAMRNQSETT